jgi:ribosomal protein S18 acetylase RimI-like enzyme
VAAVTVVNSGGTSLLARLEEYYDAVPRSAARAEDFGALTLFVRESEGAPYYARPTLNRSGAEVTADDVLRVRARQRELGVPESFEWVAEVTPELRAAVEATGLAVHEHPLMVLDAPAGDVPDHSPTVRIIEADDPALPSALALATLAFGEPGTGVGEAGIPELRAKVAERGDASVAPVRERMRAGLTVVAVVHGEDGLALCSGRHQPVGRTTEIVAVGTLPSARRRGLGSAVTRALAHDARQRGIATIFLSASDPDVERMYADLGFRTVATALIAE